MSNSTTHPWPRLDIGGGAETSQSLLFWGQILGKTRLALSRWSTTGGRFRCG